MLSVSTGPRTLHSGPYGRSSPAPFEPSSRPSLRRTTAPPTPDSFSCSRSSLSRTTVWDPRLTRRISSKASPKDRALHHHRRAGGAQLPFLPRRLVRRLVVGPRHHGGRIAIADVLRASEDATDRAFASPLRPKAAGGASLRRRTRTEQLDGFSPRSSARSTTLPEGAGAWPCRGREEGASSCPLAASA